MDEHSFIKSIHRRLANTALHVWKINARFVRGVADAWYSGSGGDLWVEYKWIKSTPAHRFTPGISRNQKTWLRDRYEEGRNIAVIIGCPDGAAILTDRTWETQVQKPAQWLDFKDVSEWISQQTLSTSTATPQNRPSSAT